jgi:hypothetical protein
MSAKVSVGVAAVFAVFMLGFAQPGGAQSTATGDVPAVRELYGMKMLSVQIGSVASSRPTTWT